MINDPRILLLADIHIGSIKDTNYVYSVIMDIIEQEVIFKHCDMIVILGDYFHRSMRVNEESTLLAINVMSAIVTACIKRKTKIRLIYGTESHEQNAYQLFNYHVTSQIVDFKVISKVTSENIFNKKILYLPEEYISNKAEYYKEVFHNKSYDYIFGHGVIIEGMPIAAIANHTTNAERRVAHFKCGELEAIGKLIIYGHYHVFSKISERCYYLGSLFRDSFGEEEPKGYGVIENGILTFVENTKAYIYKSYTYSTDSLVYNNADSLSAEIAKIKADNPDIINGIKPGKLRMVFYLPIDINQSFRENLQTLMMNEKQMTFLMNSSLDIVDSTTPTIEVEYDYILDQSLPFTTKLHRYISHKYPEVKITMSELTSLINEDLKI